MPCCHMRHDNPEHQEFILGNLGNDSLSDIFKSNRSKNLQELLGKGNYTSFPSPCKHCQKTRTGYFTGFNDITYMGDMSNGKPRIENN